MQLYCSFGLFQSFSAVVWPLAYYSLLAYSFGPFQSFGLLQSVGLTYLDGHDVVAHVTNNKIAHERAARVDGRKLAINDFLTRARRSCWNHGKKRANEERGGLW